MDNINLLKFENRNLVKDNLDNIMNNINEYIADQYLKWCIKRIIIEPCDDMVKNTLVTKTMLVMNIDLIYSALLDKGYVCSLVTTKHETYIILSV